MRPEGAFSIDPPKRVKQVQGGSGRTAPETVALGRPPLTLLADWRASSRILSGWWRRRGTQSTSFGS
jgi:hypothetical protein